MMIHTSTETTPGEPARTDGAPATAAAPVAHVRDKAMLLSVNIARPAPTTKTRLTGINKQPVAGSVSITDPGPRGGAVGLSGDCVFDAKAHGGSDQAVYAYAREDLDWWEAKVGGSFAPGIFGENLTTLGLDVNGALIGDRWLIGSNVILEVSASRIPCMTFQRWLGRDNWIKRFTQAARPGAYLRVIQAGEIRAHDPVELVHRPDHDVSVALVFRALTSEPQLLPRLLAAEALAERDKERVRRRSERRL